MSSQDNFISTPEDLRNIVREIVQSNEFHNQLRLTISETASSSTSNRIVAPLVNERVPAASPADELRRIFPSIRNSGGQNTLRNSVGNAFNTPDLHNTPSRTRKRKRSQNTNTTLLTFKRDIILEKKSNVSKTLRGDQKSCAYTNGKNFKC